jgi:hypothetical protein
MSQEDRVEVRCKEGTGVRFLPADPKAARERLRKLLDEGWTHFHDGDGWRRIAAVVNGGDL